MPSILTALNKKKPLSSRFDHIGVILIDAIHTRELGLCWLIIYRAMNASWTRPDGVACGNRQHVKGVLARWRSKTSCRVKSVQEVKTGGILVFPSWYLTVGFVAHLVRKYSVKYG